MRSPREMPWLYFLGVVSLIFSLLDFPKLLVTRINRLKLRNDVAMS